MIRRHWRYWLPALAIIAIAMSMGWHKYTCWANKKARPVVHSVLPTLAYSVLPDGSELTLVVAASGIRNRVALAVTEADRLSEKQLQALSWDASAQIVQVVLQPTGCLQQKTAFDDALKQLDGAPTVVGGIGPGATLAWHWLIAQNDANAKAVSIDFTSRSLKPSPLAANVTEPQTSTCDAVMPATPATGHWVVVTRGDHDQDSGAFVRAQHNAQTRIVDAKADLAEALYSTLRTQLLHADDLQKDLNISVTELPSPQGSDTLTIFMSGDGGWRDLDKEVAGVMASMGYPVVGIDVLRYYWDHKTPEQTALDLTELMDFYREKWGIKHFILAGYSFGADVIPAVYNRLEASNQNSIEGIILLAFARSGSFEIHLEGWLGSAGKETETGPEMAKLPGEKVLCVYGIKEERESGCTQASAVGERLPLPGKHHFDGDYPALARQLVAAIAKRQGKNTDRQ